MLPGNMNKGLVVLHKTDYRRSPFFTNTLGLESFPIVQACYKAIYFRLVHNDAL